MATVAIAGAEGEDDTGFRRGAIVGIPYAIAALLVSISFGVLAQPVMGSVAPIVMSAIVFAGSAQFAATAVLAADGGAGAAILAGILLNMRFLAMGIALAPSLPAGRWRRAGDRPGRHRLLLGRRQ
jgi:predicted branched-subunit amino acid permease